MPHLDDWFCTSTLLSPSIYNNYNNNIYMSRSHHTYSEGWGVIRVMLPAHFLHFLNLLVLARADHAGGRPSIMLLGLTDFIPNRPGACPKKNGLPEDVFSTTPLSQRLRRAGLLPKWCRVLPKIRGVHVLWGYDNIITPFVPFETSRSVIFFKT